MTPPRPPIPDPPAIGPFRPEAWRSPLRGPWLTTILGLALLVLFSVSAVTGFLSHAAYDPGFVRNSPLGDRGILTLPFDWPTSPTFGYAVSQSLHVICGMVAVPILLAKLWSVIPALFEVPAARTWGHLLERIGIALLVGSSAMLLVTGLLNVQYWYAFPFSFVPAHHWAAWVFIAALALHLVTKAPVIVGSLRTEGVLGPLRRARAAERLDEAGGLVSPSPGPTTATRRVFVGTTAAAAAAVALSAAGQSVGGPLRRLSVLGPRGADLGDGPNDFPVNTTARAAGIEAGEVGARWALRVTGRGGEVSLGRDELLAMDLATERLPIACVEGWTTTQDWTGVPLPALAELVGGREDLHELYVESIQRRGAFRFHTLNPGQALDRRSLLALRVNGADISPDHGFPARIIVPNAPGVRNTKWVGLLAFRSADDPDRGGGPA